MFGRFFRYGFSKWKNPLIAEWKKNSVWSLITSVISFAIIYFLIDVNEMKIEVMGAISLLGGTVITFLFRLLYELLNAPFSIIQEQDIIIASLGKIADRKTVISRLTELWSEGTNLRNRGEALMHQSRLEPWWNEHLDWRNKTKTTMALIDPNKANQWWTLGLYTPKRAFPHALNGLHEKRIQMFDAWLDRLQIEIQKLEKE